MSYPKMSAVLMQDSRRRSLQRLAGLGLLLASPLTQALQAQKLGLVPGSAIAPWHQRSQQQFDSTQSRILRAWMAKIIHTQLKQPTPRWQQRDCAGLVRFAVAESLRSHDAAWRQANGLRAQMVPPDLVLTPAQAALRHRWQLADGRQAAYVGALELVQENTTFVSKSWNQAQIADLFLYDHGDEQHLMVWMGSYCAYHTGSVSKTDNGLRSVALQKLLRWQDTRWRPLPDNPNFAGVFRLSILSPT